jgi:hypothetical protein
MRASAFHTAPAWWSAAWRQRPKAAPCPRTQQAAPAADPATG